MVLCKTLKYPHLKHSVLFCSADIAELWKLQKRANEMVKGVTKVTCYKGNMARTD